MTDDPSEYQRLAMPRRPRPHQLEERSRNRFRELLPDHMFARDKNNDYGVDLEIEVFNRDTTATGLLLNAQIKATDKSGSRSKMRLTRAQRNYLQALPLRSIVVRWYSVDNTFYWKWLDRTPDIEDGVKSQTIHFGEEDRWTKETPSAIETALRDWRMVERHPHSAPAHIVLNLDRYPASRRQAFTSIIRGLVDETNALTLEPAVGRLTLTIKPTPDTLRISVGTIANLEADTPDLSSESLSTLLRYMLTAVLFRLKLSQHADALARLCLAKATTSPSSELAIWAVRALTSDAQKSIELAILNGLQRDAIAPMLIFWHLRTTPYDPNDQYQANERFLKACLDAAQTTGDPWSQGAICYSLGNHFANNRENVRALKEFNQARKLRPKYCQSGYFLSEVAAVLFGAGHFVLAARFYEQAIILAPSARLALCLGDSLFFCGRLDDALVRFDEAAANGDPAIEAEGFLKAEVCQWLAAKYGPKVERRRTEAIRTMRPAGETEIELKDLQELDPLDEIANWNVAIKLTRAANHSEALLHFLVCAFRASGDTEAWTNSLLCTINMQDAPMLQAVLRCSLALGGPTSADEFCERMAASEEISQDLSNTIAAFNEEFGAGRRMPPTFRILSREDNEKP